MAMVRLTADQARRAGLGLIAQPREHKYHAEPQVVDGARFDSKRESTRWGWLQLRVKVGEIRDLQRQVEYPINVTNMETGEIIYCGAYVADFVYVEVASGAKVVEDSKGVRTAVFILKKKLVEALYGIHITEQ
jgi:hypothetical protein